MARTVEHSPSAASLFLTSLQQLGQHKNNSHPKTFSFCAGDGEGCLCVGATLAAINFFSVSLELSRRLLLSTNSTEGKTMNPQLAMIVRAVLLLLAGLLVSKGFLDRDQQETFVSVLLTLFGSVLSLITLFWSHREKTQQATALNVALTMPQGSTVSDLSKQLAGQSFFGGWQELLIRQAISTLLSTVKNPQSRAKLKKYLIPLRDALNDAFPPEE